MCTYSRTVYSCQHSYFRTLVRSCTTSGEECGVGFWHGLHSHKVSKPCARCEDQDSRMGELREGVARCRARLDRWVPGDAEGEVEVEAELDSLEALSEAGDIVDVNAKGEEVQKEEVECKGKDKDKEDGAADKEDGAA